MLKPLNKIANLKDPLKQFVSTWTFGAIDGINLDWGNLELRCQTYGFPTLTGDTTDVTWGGFPRKYAGKQIRQGTWSVTFVEVWDVAILNGFKEWANLYHQYLKGKITLLKDYSTWANIKLLDPDVYDKERINSDDASKIHEYSMRLYDVFPMEVNAGSIEASSSDPIVMDVTFNYNYFLLGEEIDEKAKSEKE